MKNKSLYINYLYCFVSHNVLTDYVTIRSAVQFLTAREFTHNLLLCESSYQNVISTTFEAI
nr:MAG TPA: hypothetical protein [Inoviridae sp.]